ncbi:MAG TPA: GntR family transcriptional regulator [Pyrinomonadaceae bacterium]|nr:GntR family transcriptional regulator [Pyrinomonadaceae bacterium]
MRLWLSKNSEVPLREQLVKQIMLGIISDDLKAGQRLPSTRELARRFHIHSNTVSAAYRELERRGWLDLRKGSGVYVRARGADGSAARGARPDLDRLIAAFLSLARAEGFSLAEVQARLRHWLARQAPDHFLVAEPDEGLREILCAEIEEATGFRTRGVGLEALSEVAPLAGAAVVALYGQAAEVARRLPPDSTPILLRAHSVAESLKGEQAPPPGALVTVVSRWPSFLEWSRVVLLAAGLDADALDFRDARAPGWRRGLPASDLVITEALTARELPPGCRARVYRVVSDPSLEELRGFVGRFLSGRSL